MASLEFNSHGGRSSYRIRAYIGSRREVISLGAFQEPEAVIAKDYVEHLIDAAKRNRLPTTATRRWLDAIPAELHKRLAELKLVEPRGVVEAERTLIAYLRAYVKERTDWKKPENYKQAIDKLETFLKKDYPLGAVKRSDVERWHRWMIQDLELSPNTAGQNVKRCRQILNQALADRLIDENPFRGVRIDLKSDKSKNRYIDEATAKAILDACPNQEWRVIFALARYGGLRTPSETLNLRWSDIHWERNRFKVRSPKTARYGKGERVIPLWPELRAELDELFAIVEPGNKISLDSFVVQRYRSGEHNLRTALGRIADAAGVEKWPKPFMALRASRRTELERAGFKNHVLNDWFGHTGAIAEEHYLQVTEADFEAATEQQTQKAVHVGPSVGPSKLKQRPSSTFSKVEKPNEKRAMKVLGALITALSIHPSGSEHSSKSPANSLTARKKGRAVGPSVGPLVPISDEQQSQLLDLVQVFVDLDDPRRIELLQVAQGLLGKSLGELHK
jgi:integrase